MSTTVFKLKKSSVPGRIPDSSDLAYGELAINYADGVLYYKNSSNEVKRFIDSDLLQAKYLDSSDVTTLVDSAYVQARTTASGNIFSTIAISGQTDVVADSTADTLTLIAGSNITLTTDSDTITIAATSSGTVIGTANNVTNNVFTGDSSTTAFTLSSQPANEAGVVVTVNGIVQHADAYILAGSTVTLDSAPVTGDAIEMRVHEQFSSNISLRDYKTYVYQPSTPTTSFSGSDINSNVLTYDQGKLEVYLNGTRLVNTLDYTATNTTTVVLLNSITSGDTLEIVSLASAAVVDPGVAKSDSDLTTTTINQVVDTFSKSQYRTVKYIAQIEHDSSNSYQAEEFLLTHNGSNVSMTTYAQILMDSNLGTFDAQISGDTISILFSPTKTNTSTKLRKIQVNA